jgi:hypothetical protein
MVDNQQLESRDKIAALGRAESAATSIIDILTDNKQLVYAALKEESGGSTPEEEEIEEDEDEEIEEDEEEPIGDEEDEFPSEDATRTTKQQHDSNRVL